MTYSEDCYRLYLTDCIIGSCESIAAVEAWIESHLKSSALFNHSFLESSHRKHVHTHTHRHVRAEGERERDERLFKTFCLSVSDLSRTGLGEEA